MTNYELLKYREKAREELGDDYVESWHSHTFGASAFLEPSIPFFELARKLHRRWLDAWSRHGKAGCAEYQKIEMDFGWWLFKNADPALLVEPGAPVMTVDGKFGIVLDKIVLDGNYTAGCVTVDLADGKHLYNAQNVRRAAVPESILAYAKAQAIRDMKVIYPFAQEGQAK